MKWGFGRKYVLFWLLGFGWSFLMPAQAPHNMYGSVISSRPADDPGAILDEIVLYSQQGPGSHRTIERNALLVRHKDAIATILICHGFMCDKFDVGFLRDLFPKGKYNIMTFDFRAHGEKIEGQCCSLGLDERYDVIAAGRFLQNYTPLNNKPIIVYGFSMGAVAAIMAQAEIQQQEKCAKLNKKSHSGLFTAMILDCPFDSAENVIKQSLESIKIPFFGYEFDIPGKSLLQQNLFHPYIQSFIISLLKSVSKLDSKSVNLNVRPIYTIDAVKHIAIPCFFIHCKNDEKVHVDAARRLFNQAGEEHEEAAYKQLLLTDGRHHFDSFFFRPERYKRKINKFAERAVKNQLPQGQSKMKEDIEEDKAAFR